MISELITTIMSYINSISAGNDMVAGAIALAFSGFFAGISAFFLRELPRKAFNLVKSQFVTSMTLNNTDYEKNLTFIKLAEFIRKNSKQSLSRTLSLDSILDYDAQKKTLSVTIGYGVHIFFYKKRIMWAEKIKTDSQGSEKQKEEITIKTIGRGHQVFHDLAEEMKPKNDDEMISVYNFKREEWVEEARAPKTGWNDIAIDDDVKNNIKNDIDFFVNNKEAFKKIGIPHKISIMLHGVPGNGKTTIIRVIASEYGLGISRINLNEHSDESLIKAFASAPEKTIIIMEDFDSCKETSRREMVQGDEPGECKPAAIEIESMKMITLSGILNVLDGVVPLDNRIVIMTTNCFNNIDSAILRDGRTDSIIELPAISPEAVRMHFENIYGTFNTHEWPELSAKEIAGIKVNGKMDKSAIMELLANKCQKQ